MSDQMFIKAADPFAGVAGALRDNQHKMCAVLDADEPHAYRFNTVQGSVDGTLVPLGSENGGIKGSRNPFGQIVVGEEYVNINGQLQTRAFTPTWLADCIPGGTKKMQKSAMPEVAPAPVFDLDGSDKEAIDEQLRQEQALRHKQFQKEIAAQRAAEEQLSSLMEGTEGSPSAAPPPPNTHQLMQSMGGAAPGAAPVPDMNMMMAMFSQMAQMMGGAPPQAQEPAEEDSPQPEKSPEGVRVRMDGAFGTYKGNYAYVYSEGPFVIMVYSEDAQVFTPPKSEEPFTLSCNGETHNVYFPGIEFELPFAKCGLQVMIRSS